jgi:hypothetical protein
MSIHVHYRRELIRRHLAYTAGGTSVAAGISSSPPPRVPEAERTDTTLTRPTARTIRAGFRRIAHPAAALPGNDVWAWRLLRRIRVASPIDQFALTGYKIDMRPPRTATSSTNVQWATAGGHDAAIVIGRNLRFMSPDAWIRFAAPIPTDAGGSLALPAEGPIDDEYLSVHTFPAGGFADTNPAQALLVREFGMELYPFVVGDSLDVGLVILASRLTSTPTNMVDGFCDIELKVSTAHRTRSFVGVGG